MDSIPLNRTQVTLGEISKYLDISPSDFKLAQERYRAVASWLEGGNYLSGFSPKIYLQGSFRLGTVVRPYRNGIDQDFDIDQVFELTQPKDSIQASHLKHDVGNRLKENENYIRMLDDEGKRCWTLIYAKQESQSGFHLDVLPSAKQKYEINGEINITDKSEYTYCWKESNPDGFYRWFKSKNPLTEALISSQKTDIFDNNRVLFRSRDDVPTRLVRTPLQRAIQIMKRHRDVYFSDRDWKPISIIITTMATHKFLPENDILEVISNFTDYVTERHYKILKNIHEADGILDYKNQSWFILNPAVSTGIENFADRWNQHDELPASFFKWVYKLKEDIRAFRNSSVSDDLNLKIKTFGNGENYLRTLNNKSEDHFCTEELLSLIYQGIDGKVEWEKIQEKAQKIYNREQGDGKDVAIINFYQIVLHSGSKMSERGKQDIQSVLSRHRGEPAFELCCNILLDTANKEHVTKILNSAWNNVFEWPIMRLLENKYWI